MLAKKKEDAEKEGGEKKEDEAPMEIDASSIEPADVKDVTDLGNGEPLFAHFVYEDWTLLSLRFELHLLAHAFRKDLDDPERPKFHTTHVSFYMNKYYRKPFSV